MIMEKVTKQQIYHKLGSFFTTLLSSIILVLILFSFFFYFSVSKYFLYLFTLLFVLLSNMLLFTLNKKKGSLCENLVQEDNMKKSELQPSLENVAQKQVEALSCSSFSLDSENSTVSIIGESFEIDHRRYQDDDEEEDEDEDGLIEIKLPSRNFSTLNEDFEQNLDSIFKQQGLMDLLAEINEMNEDENLIEIDIFKGSTKYQDFRYKELACLGDQCVLSD